MEELLVTSVDNTFIRLKKTEEIYSKYLEHIRELAQNTMETDGHPKTISLAQYISVIHSKFFMDSEKKDFRSKDRLNYSHEDEVMSQFAIKHRKEILQKRFLDYEHPL